MRILLVEDNSDHRELMRLALTEYDAAWQVEGVASGDEALRHLAEREAYDAVFLDYSLPGRDGLEALEEIRRGEAPPPVVMVTGRGDEQVAVKAMKGGAYDYVVKGEGYLQRLPVVAQRAVEAHQLAVERKRAEKALRRAEERYRGLFEEAPLMYVITRNQGGVPIIADCNQAFLSTLEYTLDEVVGRPLADFYTPESRAALLEGGYRKALEGSFVTEERRLVTCDGRVIETILSALPETDAQDNVAGTRAMYLDITERKQAEEALRESEERFKCLFQEAPVGYFEYDAQGRITRVNQTEVDMLGYPLEEMIGQPVWKFIVDEEAQQQILAKLAGAMPPSRSFERTYRRKDGTTFPALIEDRLNKDEQGKITGMRCSIQDITERKRAEEKIQASLREKELLLSEIHHRVKNNLQVISGLLDLQAASSGNPELIEMFHESQSRIRSMALIHEKLYASKNFARIDLAGYVRGLSQELFQSYKINPGEIDLIIQTGDDVYVDINKAIPCGLILNELISNALKHAFPGDGAGTITVIIRKYDNKEIEIVVCDNGLGLPDDVDIRQPRSMGLLVTNDMSGIVAHNLSGLGWSPLEVTDEMDRDATGDPEDAI